jgi:S-adenosylmethionine hydrolase
MLERAEWGGTVLRGEVLRVDLFGNILTTIPGEALGSFSRGRALTVDAPRGTVRATTGHTFGDVAPTAAVVLIGSDGFVEIACNRARAADMRKAAPGDAARLRGTDIGS